MKKGLLTIAVFLLLTPLVFVFANQIEKTDSLIQQLEVVQDSSKAHIYNQLVRLRGRAGMIDDTLLIYAQKAHGFAMEYNQESALAQACQNLGSYYIRAKEEIAKGIEYYDQAIPIFEKKKNYNAVTNLYDKIIWYLNNLGQYEKASEYILSALHFSERNNLIEDIIAFNGSLGSHYRKMKEFDKAHQYLDKALSLESEKNLPDSLSLAELYLKKGYVLLDEQSLEDAIIHFNKGLEVQEYLEDDESLMLLSNALGNAYSDQNKPELALQSYRKALNHAIVTRRNYFISAARLNIGKELTQLGNYRSSINELQKGLKIAEKNNYVEWQKNGYLYLHEAYDQMGDARSALKYFKISQELQDSLKIEEARIKIADLETKYETEQKEKQIELLNQENEIKNLKLKRRNFGFYTALGFILLLTLTGLYIIRLLKQRQKARELLQKQETELTLMENMGNYLKIANLLPMIVFILTKDRKLNFVSDSTLSLLGLKREDVNNGFDLIEMLTEKDKKSFEIDVENALNNIPTKGKPYRFRLKDDSTLPVLGFLSPNTEENKTTGVLGVMMDVSEMKKMEKELLSVVINTEDRERKRFSADLHDSLGPLLSSIKLYLGGLTDADEKEKLEMLEYTEELIDESIKSVRTISNNIMPRTLSEDGFYASLQSFADKLEFTKAIQVHIGDDVPDKRYDSSTEVILYRIVQELINNTLKHAKAENIYINFQEIENQLSIHYSDDGVGFDIKKQEPTGLGITNIRDRVKSLNGTISFNSQSGKGTEVQIKIDV